MPTNSISVLIVDDDRTIAVVLKEVISKLDDKFTSESVWAENGAAAREELKKRCFQLVLLDYMLPDENGLAVLAAINVMPVTERPVVIMLTGAGNEQVAVEAMKLGAKDYIVKTSLNFHALRRRILIALEHHQLENKLARSTEELQRKNSEMNADLALARGVQQALLPQSYPGFPAGTSPENSALKFCHRWIPSEKVAGDLFDVFPVGQNSAGIFLCDVMGHGVRAALVTALLRGLLREKIQLADRPGVFLREINCGLQTLLGHTGDLVFVTAMYVVVDATNGKMTLANAGHPAPLQVCREAREVLPLTPPEGPGPALGLLPDINYGEWETQLAPGDALLLFTDGLFEAADVDGEEFGQTRLRSSVKNQMIQSTPSLIDGLLVDIHAFRSTAAGFDDDVCIVAVDRAPLV